MSYNFIVFFSGRPIEATTSDMVEKIYHMVMEDHQIKVREIAETIDNSSERVNNILHK